MKTQAIARLALPLAVAAGLGLGCVPAVQTFTNVLTPSQAWAAADASYTDGSYTAEGKGIGGDVPVAVTVKGGKIAEVTVGDNSETQGIGSNAIEQLPSAIVAANGTEGVDAVSGATVTSKAIFTAVDDCLEQAKSGAAQTETGLWYNDGTYTAEGKGIGGKVPVEVSIKGGVISEVAVGDNSETQGIGSKAIEQLPAKIVEANGTEGVDGVSGATVTSKAIFTAVEDCLEQAGTTNVAPAGTETEEAAPAEETTETEAEKTDEAPASDAAYTDGEYFAEGKGIGGDVPVTVTVKGGKIASVEVGENSETDGIGSKAIEQLPDAIVEANGTEGVDAVSGATVTSKAIFSAVDEALEQAKGGAAAEQAAPADDAKAEDKAEDAKADDKAADTKADEAAPAEASLWYNDGEYFAEGRGIGGDVPVTVTVEGGVIVDVEVGSNSETDGIGTKAIAEIPEAIIAANGTEGVDAVSGATITSKAIFTAVDDCLEQAGTTDVAPETAASSSSSSNRTSSTTDNSDHLGALHFGGLTVTIPNGYECDGLEHETLDGLDITHGFYTSESSSSALFVMYVESDELADTIKSSDDGAKTILAVAMASLGDSFSHWEALDGSEIGAVDDVYIGGYSAQFDGSDIYLVVGGALDSEKRILVTVGIPMTESGVTEIINTVYGIEDGVIPGSSSAGSSRASNPSTSSSRSSYTPTRAEQNALNRANDYLEFMSFSRSGLIDQLEFEGYTTSEAEYAVDNCGADWDEQAVLKAEEYLDFMSFSRSGLIDQLEFEGFTYDQASAAATAVGL